MLLTFLRMHFSHMQNICPANECEADDELCRNVQHNRLLTEKIHQFNDVKMELFNEAVLMKQMK